MMRVAVVIPCYNGARYLREAIESAHAQVRPPDEILVVDDASSDDSVAVATAAGARVVASPENRGSACARNLGLASTNADLVAFLDSDDAWTPMHLSVLVPAFENARVGLAFGQTVVMGSAVSTEPPALLTAKSFFLDLIDDNIITQSAVVARREAVLRAGGYQPGARYAEDYDLWLRMALEHDFVTTNGPTCLRRLHAAQLSQNNAAFVMAAFSARRDALDLANRMGKALPTMRVEASLSRAAMAELETARYLSDWETVIEVSKVTSLFPSLKDDVDIWKERHRMRWPFYQLVATIRRWLGRTT